MTFFKSLLNLILPPRCFYCGKVLDEDKGLCDSCISKIDFLNGAVCHRCGRPLPQMLEDDKKLLCGECLKPHRRKWFRLARSAAAYDEFSKKLILDFKFYDKTDLASLLAKMMFVAGKDIFETGVDVIIPVPLHYTRLMKRKYNQSALLAKELGKLAKIKVAYDTVIKKRKTKPQVECSGDERLKNVRDAFVVKNPEKVAGKRILLIDDVLTTGTTLKECTLALKKAKPKSVDWLTVTRVV